LEKYTYEKSIKDDILNKYKLLNKLINSNQKQKKGLKKKSIVLKKSKFKKLNIKKKK